MASKKTKAPAPEKKKPGRKLVPGDPSLTTKEKEAIVAVKEFEVTERVLDLFKIENGQTFKIYGELLDEREQKRQVAEAAIKSVDASFGPWERFSEQKTYYPMAVYQHLGEKGFLELGGKLETETVYILDKEKIELAIAANKIPEEIIPEIRKVTPKYRSPK